jgi:hypothetical protein
MSTTPEGKVKAKVKIVLDSLNAYYAMPMGTGFGNAGVPDFLVCIDGQFIAIECKAGNNKPTALQLHNLMRIRKAGGFGFVVNEMNIDELKRLLEERIS